jgi:hypothetical protein
LIAALALAPVVASGEQAEASTCPTASTGRTYGGGAGTAGTPYLISSESHILELAATSGDWDKDFLQDGDLDLQGCAWTPIGDWNTSFTGNFDGGHNTISNLIIQSSFDLSGFFGYLEGNISNVRLVEVDIDVQEDYVGGIAGYGESGSSIRNSSVSGSISGAEYVGGLVGQTEGQTEASFSSANVEGTGDVVGGLIGRFVTFSPFLGNPSPRVRDSYATGNVRGANTVGGLIGNQAQSGGDAVSNSYSTGLVTSSGQSPTAVGGSFGSITHPAPGVYWQTDGQESLSSAGALFGSLGNQEATKIEGATSTELRTLGTFTSADSDSPWDIVASESFDAPNPSGPGGDRKIWGIGSGMNCGYPFLWWQTVSAHTCTAQSSGGGSSSSSLASASPALHMDLKAKTGDAVAGSSVLMEGQGLAPGSSYSLVVRSTPMTVKSGAVTGGGTFSHTVTLPAGIAPGVHTITLSATGSDGSALLLTQSFTVAPNGTFSALGSVTGQVTGGLAATGVDGPLTLGATSLAALMVLVGVALMVARRRAEALSS